jgi:hypothetical protein
MTDNDSREWNKIERREIRQLKLELGEDHRRGRRQSHAAD